MNQTTDTLSYRQVESFEECVLDYFGRNIWESYTLVDSACEYTPVMCWQTSFRGYLENEYTLGSDIYIYGTFLGLDHSEKRIIFNVREFLTRPEETIYEERLEKITELKK